MINWQRLLLPLFTVRQYLFYANSIVCYSFKTRPNTITTMILNRMGVYKVDFSSPDSYILGFVALICTVSYMVSILALWKLKNETPVKII